jgi:hypothetical protein
MSDVPGKDFERSGPVLRWAENLFVIVIGACFSSPVGAVTGMCVYSSRGPDSNLAPAIGLFEGARIGLVVGTVIGIVSCLIWRISQHNRR